MLGWQIYIHRQDPASSPAKAAPTDELPLATWQAGIGGLDWLHELVREGKAVDLGGNGYPLRYSATPANLLTKISDRPPEHEGPLVLGDDYATPGGWVGNVGIDHSKIARCLPDEQLTIEAWDLS